MLAIGCNGVGFVVQEFMKSAVVDPAFFAHRAILCQEQEFFDIPGIHPYGIIFNEDVVLGDVFQHYVVLVRELFPDIIDALGSNTEWDTKQ